MQPSILFVDDDPHDVELARFAFAKCGTPAAIDIARDGQDAIDYLLCKNAHAGRPQGNPAVVFLDLKLPRVDGFDVLKFIRSTPRFSAIPVVVLSAVMNEDDYARATRLGIDEYVVKPMELEQFVRKVCDIGPRYVGH